MWRPCPSVFHLTPATKTSAFMTFRVSFFNEKLSSKREFRANQFTDSHTSLSGYNKFSPGPSTFLSVMPISDHEFRGNLRGVTYTSHKAVSDLSPQFPYTI